MEPHCLSVESELLQGLQQGWNPTACDKLLTDNLLCITKIYEEELKSETVQSA